MCYGIAYNAAGGDTYKAWHDKAMVYYERPNPGCTGAIKANTGKVGRVSRQNKVPIASRHEGYYY